MNIFLSYIVKLYYNLICFIQSFFIDRTTYINDYTRFIINVVDCMYQNIAHVRYSIEIFEKMDIKNMFDLIKDKHINKLNSMSNYQLVLYDKNEYRNDIYKSIDNLCKTLNTYLFNENDD